MKLGIITYTYGQNYGNKLQNYALLTFLKEHYGDYVYTLQNYDETTKKGIKAHLKSFIKNTIKCKETQSKKNRKKVFDAFNKNFLSYYPIPIIRRNFDKFKDFDAFICGSDQIWNPYYNKNMDIFTANFASSNSKRISYAASIGLSELSEDDKEIFSKTVGTMDYIGIREKEGAELLKSFIDKDVTVQLDPTMLLDVNLWNKFSKKPKKNIPEKYIITYFIKNKSNEINNTISNYAKENNIKIINLNDISQREWFDIDPCEFAWMIKNAEFVFSDSFHATVFSIIFHVPFFCFERKNKEKTNKQESRLYTLLGYFDLQNRIGEFSKTNLNDIFWENIDKKLESLREKSAKSLLDSIGKDRMEINTVYNRKEECCGCGLCAIECPESAISMQLDEEGYRYPVIDTKKCIRCGKCKKSCIYNVSNKIENNKNEVNAYKVKHRDSSVREKSSSGGVFSALAKYILENNGIVVAPAFDENFELKHKMIFDEKDIGPYRGSKYTQSQSEELFSLIKKQLQSGKNILYTGTPCQIYALKVYLKEDYENLITQDLICHGCTSEKVFKDYLKNLEIKMKSKVKSVNFRSKENGWRDFGIKIKFENNREIFESHRTNKFFNLFLNNYTLRPSCYDCYFRKINRISNITLADFWGINGDDDKGVSLVIENNNKLMESLNELEVENVDFLNSIKNNSAYNSPIVVPQNRNKIIKENNINKLFIKYKIDIFKQRIYRKINSFFR